MAAASDQRDSLRLVQRELERLCEDVSAYAARLPSVEGTHKLLGRAKRELAFAEKLAGQGLLAGREQQAGGAEPCHQHVQGLWNNFRGLRAEVQVAEDAPNVVAVCKRFSAHPQDGGQPVAASAPEAEAVGKAEGEWQVEGEAEAGAEAEVEGVEVDVVAQGGHCWIEVKCHEQFSRASSHWHGRDSHGKGLQQQVRQQLAVASAPCNALRWRAPALVLHFPLGVDEGVRQQLHSMGVHVTAGALSATCLPPPPPAPTRVNLCTTAMCALVAEVCHVSTDDAHIVQWSQRNVHWRDCLAAERQGRLLDELQPLIQGRPLIASAAAVAQFESILQVVGGVNEKARWQQLLVQIAVFPQGAANPSGRIAAAAGAGLTARQVYTFELGDEQRAVTLTANGRAVEALARRGVLLESHVHRPAWLCGM